MLKLIVVVKFLFDCFICSITESVYLMRSINLGVFRNFKRKLGGQVEVIKDGLLFLLRS